MDDHALMARLQAGDDTALEALIDRHRPWAERLAVSMLHDPAAAEDVVQEAFARVYLLRGQYQPTYDFRAWLGTLVRRLCIDALRRRKRRAEATARLSSAREEGSAESAYWQKEKRLRLWALLDALPPIDRALVTGYALDGLSYRELAQKHRLTVGQVRIRLHRIRKRLREKERDEP